MAKESKKKKMNKKVILTVIIVILVIALIVGGTIGGVFYYKAHTPIEVIGQRPSQVTTQDQPFVENITGESEQFRIPAMVTLNSGRIVTAADARHDIPLDGGGLDTIVSYSDDNGNNWTSYTANYLGDNGNLFNKESSAFIDPELLTDGENVWLMTTFFPGNRNSSDWTGIKEAVSETAFNDDGTLKISSNSGLTYGYYADISNFVDGYTPILKNNGKDSGYKINEYFYLFDKDGEEIGNIFYNKNRVKFSVVPTTYMYMTKSTDGGESFGAPMLINVKGEDEAFYGVGPGRGICTKDGTLIMSSYTFDAHSSYQSAGFIYSRDGGKTWTRQQGIEPQDSFQYSGESQLVELDDGTLRCFFRNGSGKITYIDATRDGDGYKWGDAVSTDVSANTACMVSALKLDENGKQYILVSCPTKIGTDEDGNMKFERREGKVFTFELNESGDMTLLKETPIDSEIFAYSCLAQMNNKNIAMLYEYSKDCAHINFVTFELNDLL